MCSSKISKYLWYKDLEVSTILYTFVPKKREQLCFQQVVRMVVIRQSEYCYKNATLLTCQNYRILNYNELAEFGSQTSLSALHKQQKSLSYNNLGTFSLFPISLWPTFWPTFVRCQTKVHAKMSVYGFAMKNLCCEERWNRKHIP